ncbi:chromosomal replication initiator protein DnaA [Roseburia sp. MUC/MUC-530-WT-4D]|uniref:Chromosomal replication initiator protein DnaA n=1 Tax=Roseburia porci TaxID=2605790 RepID=A0A6L5YV59_9FIRM|nr:chromosomal replication initiator protein DnaA [Roseburia porci]MCI5517595.1 chromosomal replication initiator protein DnaA [Roseburia sp.]MDD6742468.1 chromosomal replication initiator protein DnaA [Roseburia porci]MST75856.1 chromosomal replication initiator protein DnaA [Roseburia porci]
MDQIIEKWNEILNTVKTEHEISDVSFDTWMRPLEVFGIVDNKLYILVPSEQMALSYISKKYYLPLKVAIAEITGIEYEIEFILPEQAKKLHTTKAPKTPSAPVGSDNSNLNPNYTFETFVVGNNNRFAQSAALAVAESPGEAYNPLYIYGGPGLGKTHLMHSIGHFILEQKPDTKVIYVTSEEFTNEVIESIRNGNASSMTKFRDKYRKVDVLMIDDIQFIIGKESTQEEFFHTFNALQTQGKQIILTSDKPPKEMETLEERIRSRFEWGLMADIGVPDYETRMAILRKKAESDNFNINDEILNYIANNIKSNVRELEGALNKLLAYNNLVHTEITMDIAQKELQNIITPDKPKEITPQLIIEVVSEHFQISLDQMISKNRSSDIAKPRQIAMYLCKNMTDIPLDTIGSLLGGRDHSTIIHGIKKISEEYETNETTKSLIETIKKKINPN